MSPPFPWKCPIPSWYSLYSYGHHFSAWQTRPIWWEENFSFPPSLPHEVSMNFLKSFSSCRWYLKQGEVIECEGLNFSSFKKLALNLHITFRHVVKFLDFYEKEFWYTVWGTYWSDNPQSCWHPMIIFEQIHVTMFPIIGYFCAIFSNVNHSNILYWGVSHQSFKLELLRIQ